MNSRPTDNILNYILNIYKPYFWYFVISIFTCLSLAFIYIYYSKPVYEISATLIITDQNKGVENPDLLGRIDLLQSKQIVENEIEVLKSRKIINAVVNELSLYAPVIRTSNSEKKENIDIPIQIKVYNPDLIKNEHNENPISFTYNPENQLIKLQVIEQNIPLDRWIDTEWGTIKFLKTVKNNSSSIEEFEFNLLPPAKAEEEILDRLDVIAANKLSSVVYLEYRDNVPERGEKILNAIIEAYNTNAILTKNNIAKDAVKIINSRLAEVLEELNQQEAQIGKFRSDEGIVDLSQQGRLYLDNQGSIDQKILELRTNLAALRKSEDYVRFKEGLSGSVPSSLGIDNPTLTQLLQNLYKKEIEYASMSNTTGSNNPMLSSLKMEIETLRPNIIDIIKNQRDNLEARLTNLEMARNKSNETLESLPLKEKGLVNISRKKATTIELYDFLLQKKEELSLAYNNGTESRIVDPAKAAPKPVSPKTLIVIAVAFIIGICITVFVVVYREFISDKIRSALYFSTYSELFLINEIEAIKQVKSNDGIESEKHRNLLEKFRESASELGLFSKTIDKNKLLITSFKSNEGKSFVARNLAYALALSGKKVAILDLDSPNFKMSNHFQLPITSEFNDSDLVEFIEGNLKTVAKNLITILNLDISPNNLSAPNKSVKALPQIIEYLDTKFDITIIIVSSTKDSADAIILDSYVDEKLFVVRKNKSSKKGIMEFENRILKKQKSLNIILNHI